MTINIPQKAGFMPTPEEWAQLVRIAENLAAQVVQRDAALRQMQAELDAARRDLITTAENWHASEKALDAARAEVARLLLLITGHNANAETTCKRWQAEGYCVTAGYDIRCNECPQEWTIDALRQPAPAGGEARP